MKWRGCQEPVSPSSSLDILSDFRVLQSEIKSFRSDEKGCVLDRFLGLFEAYGLSDIQSVQTVTDVDSRMRHHGSAEKDVADDTGALEASESDNRKISFSQRRTHADISSEEETLSWSPVLVDSQRQQSDLARRREMSDLLNKWILKTGNQNYLPQARGLVPPPVPAQDDELSSAMDISELQRLMRQHQTGREESNLADELYKLMHPEALDESGKMLSSACAAQSIQSPPSPNVKVSRATDNSVHVNRWSSIHQAGVPHKRTGLRHTSSPYSNPHVEFGQSRRVEVQSATFGGEKSSASIRSSSENNSYAAIAVSHPVRSRPNMATSMGMHDVEYYGPERKAGVANKIRGALLTMKVRNQKLAEGLSQFKSSLPTEDVIRIIVAILQNFGATTLQLKRETKRKLKCKVHIHDDHYLCAAIEFSSADNAQGTVVTFKRSKEDRGRTNVASFHEFYENVRERFIAEVQNRYDRGDRNLSAVERSVRNIGGSSA